MRLGGILLSGTFSLAWTCGYGVLVGVYVNPVRGVRRESFIVIEVLYFSRRTPASV